MISSSLPGTSSETQPHQGGSQNAVPHRLIDELNWPLLESMHESSNLMMDYEVQEVLHRGTSKWNGP